MAKKIRLGLNKRKTDKINLLKFSDEVPAVISKNLPLITLFGDSQVQIDGCFGIIEYEDCIIKLSVKKGFITFMGKDLKITSFTDYQIVFTGTVTALEFSV